MFWYDAVLATFLQCVLLYNYITPTTVLGSNCEFVTKGVT